MPSQAGFSEQGVFWMPVSPPARSFLSWNCSLGPHASPGNNQNNFLLGRKEMEFQMKKKMNKGGFDTNATGGARSLLRHSLPFPPRAPSWRHGRQGSRGSPLPTPRAAKAASAPRARASPLRAPAAELQFDISRPARARLESEHVPGCFIAAAAAAGAQRMCVCVRG